MVIRLASVSDQMQPPDFYEIDACLRGPNLAASEKVVRSILGSGVPTPVWSP